MSDADKGRLTAAWGRSVEVSGRFRQFGRFGQVFHDRNKSLLFWL